MEKATPSLRFRHLTVKDGLSQSHIYAILQGRVGFMWFGTWEGLNRFDFVPRSHQLNFPHTRGGEPLAYRLYAICERKGWAEHARDYNALVISWGASQEQAREFKKQYQQGTLF